MTGLDWLEEYCIHPPLSERGNDFTQADMIAAFESGLRAVERTVTIINKTDLPITINPHREQVTDGLDKVLEDYKQLLYQIQNSRKGYAPHLVYCDNLFRVSRIDEQMLELEALVVERGD